MVTGYHKIELFGKPFIQKVELKPPFEYSFPVAEQACFLYPMKGGMRYRADEDLLNVPTGHSLLLNCIQAGNQLREAPGGSPGELVVVTFHPDVLKKVYDKEMPHFQSYQGRSKQLLKLQMEIIATGKIAL